MTPSLKHLYLSRNAINLSLRDRISRFSYLARCRKTIFNWVTILIEHAACFRKRLSLKQRRPMKQYPFQIIQSW